MKKTLLSFILIVSTFCPVFSQNRNVETVYLIFKTHLDIGYTDFSCNVEKQYLEKFIPQAIEISRQLRDEGGEERYVWTTGAWLINSYLKHSSPEARRKLEEAIEAGDIHWNAMPYTVESESLSKELLESILALSATLDRRFGKNTIAAKMTDVPGHTRSIVPVFADCGIKMLHVGVNGCSTVPEVPVFFKWRDEGQGKEILVVYDGQYGGGNILPDGKTAVEISFTGDNEGPHSVESVKNIYAELHKKYPMAKIVAGSLDDVALAFEKCSDNLPVITSEIADTWIYGYASSPMKIARYRELLRLYSFWAEKGLIDKENEQAIDFAVRLGLVAEHTWGSRGSEVGNFHIYDMDSFSASRNLPSFRYAEMTWDEQSEYVAQAARMLPSELREEALYAIDAISHPSERKFKESKAVLKKADSLGRFLFNDCLIGGISYQSYSKKDYLDYQNNYVRVWNPGFDKVNLEAFKSESHIVNAVIENAGKIPGGEIYEMKFPLVDGIDSRVYPGKVQLEYSTSGDGLDITVTVIDKPAVRLPESLWISFPFDGILGLIAEKTGYEVDLLGVVPGGNRRMHFIDSYVDILTDNGTIRISSLDAPILTIGERNGIGFKKEMPDLSEGIHFCLYNNLWSTNFNLWWEGSIKYRFHIQEQR